MTDDFKWRKIALVSCNKTNSIILNYSLKYTVDLFCLSYLYPFRALRKRKSHEKVSKSSESFKMVTPNKENDNKDQNW